MKNRILNFKAAFRGFITAFKSEWNLRFHVLSAITALVLSVYLNLKLIEFLIILLCIGIVISMELINTSIEYICDFIHPDKHHVIKKIKDISAAAVLISSIISLITGIVIILPKILNKLN